MNVALIADTAWLDEELSQLHYLVVGLIDEQVRVVQVMPEELPIEESTLLGERVTWTEAKWPRLNRRRIARLDHPLVRAEVQIIHALDHRLWAGALMLADEMSVPVVLGANTSAAVESLERLLKSTDLTRVAFAAATEPIAQAMREKLGPDALVETVFTGVHVGEPTLGCATAEALCAIVSGNGRLDDDYMALLQGMREVCREHPQTQFFLDGQGSEQHQLWKAARRLGLLPNLSLIPRRLGHRELLLRADVLIHPQALGQSRSVTLQAMSHALTVIAQQDPWLDYLLHEQTCWAVEHPTPDMWAEHLQRLIDQPSAAQALGRRAREWVHENRLVSEQIARVLGLYRRITGQTLPFPG